MLIFYKLPITIMDQCRQAHQTSQPNSKSDKYYYMQAVMIESTILWISFICYFVYGIIKHYPEANAETDVKIHYFIFCLLVFGVFPGGTFCYNIYLSEKNRLRDRLIANGCEIFCLIYYWLGLTLITCVAQFIAFHSFYIAIATTVVSVYQILSFIILLAGITFTILFDIANVLKTLNGRRKCSLQNFITFIALNILFIWIFVMFMYINENGDLEVMIRFLLGLSFAGLIIKDTVKKILKYSWRKCKNFRKIGHVVSV